MLTCIIIMNKETLRFYLYIYVDLLDRSIKSKQLTVALSCNLISLAFDLIGKQAGQLN